MTALSGVGKVAGQSELRGKLVWTFFLLAVYRIGVHVPIPGIDSSALQDFFAKLQGTLLGVFDMFSGGGLSNLSLFALGVMPYISASIIMQLVQVMIPELKRTARESAAGRKKITQYTRYLTVLISLVQAFALALATEGMQSPAGIAVVADPGWTYRFVTVATITAGSMLVMWIGEQITERGIGNGISLIIFSGIVAGLPSAIISTFSLVGGNALSIAVFIGLAVFMAAVLVAIVFVERGQRRIPIQYAKRQVGRKMYGGQNSHLPIKINTAGVIPPIFASSLLLFPPTVASFSDVAWAQKFSSMFSNTSLLYNLLFVALIFLFSYFYTAIVFDPKEIAENLKKQGGSIPGIRPGQKTYEYLDRVLVRLTLWGSLYITTVCLIPQLLISQLKVPFYFGGTSLLIVVGVAMDFMSRLESYMISRQYEGLLGGKGRIKGRNN